MPPPGPLRFVALSFLLLVSELVATPVEQSVSTSGQFIVYGTDLPTRGAICDLAERTKRELLACLRQRDAWSTAIIINALYPQANLPELPRFNLDLGQTGFGLKLQLDLLIDRAVNWREIRRQVLRGIIVEMAYRGEQQVPAGAMYRSPPEWLLDGIPSEQSDMTRERVGAILGLSKPSANVWPLHKFLTHPVKDLDEAARTLYRAHSFALVDLLSRGPEGPHRLTQFILNLPHASNDPMEDLRKHFPEIFGTESAEATWQKQIARLSRDQPYQLLSGAETERRLDEILRLTISDGGDATRYDLAQFPVFLRRKTAPGALSELATRLAALGVRAHPLYAQIIAEYAQIVSAIQRGRTLMVGKHLEQLASKRPAMSAQSRAIDDYLNWFEATRLVHPSGQFVDYIKAAERAAQPPRTRRDPISIYLDALEFQLEEEKPAVR
jgi:hypothetical protein